MHGRAHDLESEPTAGVVLFKAASISLHICPQLAQREYRVMASSVTTMEGSDVHNACPGA
jgi:hypothetical protein